ncbi:MAG: DUF1553 domain-containing protein [Acidobacteria bacterium]|nr:DUF1553 domain-containing protein [Acidobacteriota bacterium]
MRLAAFRFAAPLLLAALASAEPVDFVRDVQPIFQKACVGCHGEGQQLGQLRLDVKSIALKGGLSGKTIVPGDPETSELYRRVAGLGDQPRMPMGGELPAAETATLKAWIAEGAKWPDEASAEAKIETHWSFIPPKRAAPPQVGDAEWSKNPIDRFILAKLTEQGLKPSAEADRTTLLRRAYLDIVGLPPTIEQTDRFLADKSPQAYAKLIDELLASPHYGERWGRRWLDAARYADSDGFEKDKPREVWFYRDWVINALNQDTGYDRFVLEQLAGDLLPQATQSQRVATGFLRNSMINEEGGIDPEQFRMEAMFDRMDAVGKAMLGLTVQCAQCHNHKFDPLTQEEYYRLFAFLNNSHEANIVVYTDEEQNERRAIFEKIDAIENRLMASKPGWRKDMAAWEQKAKQGLPEWETLKLQHEEPSGQKYHYYEDGSILAQGYAPTRHVVTLFGKKDLQGVQAFELELLMDPNLPRGGPGRSVYGTAALTEFEVELIAKDDPKKKTKLHFVEATADVNPEMSLVDLRQFPDKEQKRRLLGDVGFAIDGFAMSAWSTDNGPGRRNQPRKAVFRLDKPIDAEGEVEFAVNLSQQHGGYNSDDNQNLNLGRFRISVTKAEDAVADPLPAKVRQLLSVPAERRTKDQERTIFSYWRTTVGEWADANAEIETLWKRHPEGTTQLVMMEREDTRLTHRLERGNFLKPKETVEPGTPRFLPAMHAETPQEAPRLQFAEWLTDRGHPTTARSIVNRIWQGYFGVGLVETAEDLGTQAPDPSHPELLDWLAVELMENDWSLKHIHRLIMTSKTYRQSAAVTPELLEKDPKNRWLARAPRLRVEGEIVRDLALAASGLLSEKMGGPPVYPPAPKFLFLPPASYGPKRWTVEEGEDRYRRGIYTFRYRSVPYPQLDAFDTPNGDAACIRRARSNTPLQALTTLNETTFLEAARALAARTLESGGKTDAERLEYAFRRVLTRKPVEAEKAELLAMLDKQRGRLRAGELDAQKLTGEAQPELAAWTTVSRVLLNLDEAITKE